jgi:hypothetical protein
MAYNIRQCICFRVLSCADQLDLTNDIYECNILYIKCIKIRKSTKMSKIFFLSMCDVKVFLTFTSLNLVLLWQLFYLFCSSIVINTVIVTSGTFEPFGALKSDSTHHFFRNACTKSGSLRFSQFSGCWLILSVYMLMSFDFPFVRLFGVR